MTAWDAFVLGCIVSIVIEMMIGAVIWLMRSRPAADPYNTPFGDQ